MRGMEKVIRYEICLKDVSCRQQFQERVREVLPCPHYFGRNLDALYDVLTEWDEQTEIVFSQFQEFSHRMPGYAEAVEHLCADVMAENRKIKIILND